MTQDQARDRSVEYLLSSAEESLESAEVELATGHTRFAMNRIYYACFYAVSAILLQEGKHFVKHAGVRSALHQRLIKRGRVTADMGRFYDGLFKDRQQGDYGMFVEFTAEDVSLRMESARHFVDQLKRLLAKEE